MPLSSENRLIGYTLDQINASRKAAGVAPVSSAPVNARAAEQQFALQNSNADTKGVRVGSNEFAGRIEANLQTNYQTAGSGFGNNVLTPEKQKANDAAMKLADASIFTKAPGYNPAKGVTTAQQNTYANQGAGLATSYDKSTGVTSAAGNGAIDQSAIDRLRASGMTDEQIRQRMQENRPQIQSTMSNTGLGGSFDQNGMYTGNSTREQAIADLKSQIDNIQVTRMIQTGTQKDGTPIYSSVVDPSATQAAKDAKQASFDQQDAYDMQQQQRADANTNSRDAANAAQQASLQAGKDKAAVVKSSADAKIKGAVKMSAFDSWLATLTPQDQQLAQGTRAAIEMQNEALGEVAANALDTKTQGESLADQLAAGQKTIIDLQEKTAAENKDAWNKLLTDQKAEVEANLLQQKRDAQEALNWNTQTTVRTAEKNKSKMLEDMAASAALSGNAFSSNAMQAMSTAEQDANQAIDDLQAQSGFKNADINNAYTTAYIGFEQQYAKDIFSAMKDYKDETNRIIGLRFTTEENKVKEKQRVDDIYSKTLSDIAIKKADNISSSVKDIRTAINQSRDDTRAQEQLGFQRMQWALTTYGSNIPKSYIDSLAKSLPGINVQDLINTATLAERNGKKTGGGGSGSTGLSFPAYLMQPSGGKPTFDSFVSDREKLLGMSLSPKARADLKKEYDASLAATKHNNPTDIMNAFVQRATAQNMSGPVYKRTSALVDGYLKRGQYDQAQSVVDNIGDDIPSTESVMFQQALNARFDVLRLHDAMQEIGGMGPITGRVKNLDPYNPAVVRVQNMITQTVPNLARGIFREVGVLTDTDVARYTKTLENPNLTVEEAQNAYNDLVKKVNVSMQNQISVWDAGNKRTKGIKDIFNSAVPNSGIGSGGPQSSDADTAFALSILSGK